MHALSLSLSLFPIILYLILLTEYYHCIIIITAEEKNQDNIVIKIDTDQLYEIEQESESSFFWELEVFCNIQLVGVWACHKLALAILTRGGLDDSCSDAAMALAKASSSSCSVAGGGRWGRSDTTGASCKDAAIAAASAWSSL